MKEQDAKKKVLIVGAGLSGLTAANDLLPTADVTILEAMDRVGGRTWSVKVQDAYYDLGAQWIGPKHSYIKKLAADSKNQLLPQFHTGTKIMQFGKSIQTYSSDIPSNISFISLIHMQFNLWKWDRMASKVPISDPTQCPNAVYWDSMTLCTWLKQNVWFERVHILLEVACRALLGAETHQVSLLFWLWYINCNGGINNLINIKDGCQEKKCKYGTQHMSHYLKEQIQKKNGKVILSQWVSTINQQGEQCVITTTDNNKYVADYVIVALPPMNVPKIKFTPDLSLDRKLICNKNMLGSSSKAIFLYQRAYWREKGFSGQTLSDCFDSPIFNAYDDTRYKENGQAQPAIVVFMNGSISRQWIQKKDWQQTVVQRLAQYFKCDEMLKPIAVRYQNWQAEPSIGGSPVGYFPPGALTQIKDFRKPQGKIHWAGTQLARISQGYMDGAVQSGKRVAQEVAKRIAKQQYYKQKTQQNDHKESFWYNKIATSKGKYFEWW